MNGTRHGYGTTVWRNGDVYMGEYSHGLEQGFGTRRLGVIHIIIRKSL